MNGMGGAGGKGGPGGMPLVCFFMYASLCASLCMPLCVLLYVYACARTRMQIHGLAFEAQNQIVCEGSLYVGL